MGKSIKYKIGYKLNDWTIKNINESSNKISYHLICKCGQERKNVSSGHLTRVSCCRFCYGEKESNHLIGKRFGRLTVLSNERINGVRKLKVLCDCGKEYFMYSETLKNSRSCESCRQGYYPGKIIEGVELLRRVEGRLWEMKCKCGTIFQSIPKFHKRDRKNFVTCGCRWDNHYLKKLNEKLGYRFGLLKVIGFEKEPRHYILVCKCKCGNIITVKNGHEFKQNSCGCLKKINNPKAEKKGNARFKNHEILSIREFYENKIYTVDELANMFEVDKTYITRIVKGKIWKSLPNSIENLKKRAPKKRGPTKRNENIKEKVSE